MRPAASLLLLVLAAMQAAGQISAFEVHPSPIGAERDAFVFHNLQALRYPIQGLDSEPPKVPFIQLEVPVDSQFTPSALRPFVR